MVVEASPSTRPSGDTPDPLESAIAELDTFPAVLFRAGNPVLCRGGWHEEISW